MSFNPTEAEKPTPDRNIATATSNELVKNQDSADKRLPADVFESPIKTTHKFSPLPEY